MRRQNGPLWPKIVLTALAVACVPVLAIATNMVTSDTLPTTLSPYRRWAWPALAVLGGLSVLFAVIDVTLKHHEEQVELPPQTLAEVNRAEGSPVFLGAVSGGVRTQAGPTIYLTGDSATVQLAQQPASQAVPKPHPSVRVPEEPVPSMLPPDIGDFVDRQDEFSVLATALCSVPPTATAVPVATIAGPAGVGKSALAIHLAHRLFGEFPDGILYVDLRGSDREPLSAATVLDVFLYAIGIPPERVAGDLEGRQALYRTWLKDRRVLVILDNAADEPQVRPLLPNRPPAAALITGRRPLVHLGAAGAVVLRELDADSATLLMRKVAHRPDNGNDNEEAAAAVIAQRCGYLPLALRVAAGALVARPHWTVGRLATELEDEHTRLLRLSEQGLGGPQLDVRASLDLSYTGLPAELSRFFRLLGAVPAIHFDRRLVSATAGVCLKVADEYLDRLVQAQLLQVQAEDGRYRLHDLVRLYARDLLERTDSLEDREHAAEQALRWYVDLAEQTYAALHPERCRDGEPGAQALDQAEALSRLDAERLNLVCVMTTALATRSWDLTARLAVALGGYYRMRSAWDDWHHVGRLGLEAAQASGDPRAEGKLRCSLAGLHELTDELDLASTYCLESLEIARRNDDGMTTFEGLRILGVIRTKQQRYPEAVACFEEALEISAALDYAWGQGASLHHLGRVELRRGRVDEAVGWLRRSLEVSQRIGNSWGEATNLTELGMALQSREDHEQAVAFLRRSRELYDDLGDRWGFATATYRLGLALLACGRDEQGRGHLVQSRQIYQELGDTRRAESVQEHITGGPAT
jgi:tetratricopeptide (TPR) repeat protein